MIGHAFSMNKDPFAYFITFRTYGTWLHGDQKYSVSRQRNQFNTPAITPWEPLCNAMRAQMNEAELILNEAQCKTVLQSVINTCQYNHWKLYAAHVRTNHIHIVLASTMIKEKTLTKLKCYATKDLKKYHPEFIHRKHFWSRHGSTKNIWAPATLFPVLYYVIKQQGSPIALFYDSKHYDLQDEALYEAYFL